MPQQGGIGFDTAYQALDEIFAGHPLRPALFTAYFEGDLFSRISDSAQIGSVGGRDSKIRNRFRDFHDQSQLFWAMLDEIYNMGVREYKVWIKTLWTVFAQLLEAAAKGKNELPQFYDAMHNAIIRDYRYFGETDKAVQLEGSGISSDPKRIAEGELKSLGLDLDPKNEKSGYRLARRLCNRERPLLLKFLGDQIIAASWYVKQSGGFDGMQRFFNFAPKFRLFCSKSEWDTIYTIFADNKSGAGEGGKQGQTLGNKFLKGTVGTVLLGAIQRFFKGDNSHSDEVNSFLNLAFYMDWDDWLSKFIAEMVRHESPNPGRNPELRVISNNSRHFANTGAFENTQPLTNRALQNIQTISSAIHNWSDAKILNQEAVAAMQGQQTTGSGRSGTTSNLPPEAPRDTVMAEKVPAPRIDPIKFPSHCDEQAIGGGCAY